MPGVGDSGPTLIPRSRALLEVTMTLWRYMTLAKYIDLLESRSVYFCRADLFEDQTEGEWFAHVVSVAHRQLHAYLTTSLTAINRVQDYLSQVADPTMQTIRDAFDACTTAEERDALNISDDVDQLLDESGLFFKSVEDRIGAMDAIAERYRQLQEEAAIYLRGIASERDHISHIKRRGFISSWFSGESQSIGMWSVYGAREGVAVTTTRKKLAACRNINGVALTASELYFGDVIYVDEDSDDIPAAYSKSFGDARDLFLKHRAFEYESEYRAVLLQGDNGGGAAGHKLRVCDDLNDFIDRVVISPWIGEDHWITRVVRAVNAKWGVSDAKLTFGRIKSVLST